MPVIAPPHRKSAEVERAIETNIGALDAPNIQLVMTCSGNAHECVMSPELAQWLLAKCEETGGCALDILVACAEMCAELD
jgi:hypothetical protein